MDNSENTQTDGNANKKPVTIWVTGLNMGWLMGLEPTTTGITIQGSTN